MKKESSKVSTLNAEKTLALIAKLILQIGVAASIILLLLGIYYYFIEWEEETGMALFIAVIPTFCFSVISWSTLSVFCNISNSLKEINGKIASKQTNTNN
jgi:hypothetical protein